MRNYHTGADHYCKYEYREIKNFDMCCTCKHFYDNEMETRFECHSNSEKDDCYENRYEDEE